MSTLVRFTTSIVHITNLQALDGLSAPDDQLVEVLGYRSMRLSLRVYGMKGPAPGQLVLGMETGMTPKDPKGFASLGVFDPIGDSPMTVQRVFTDLQRYARWRVFLFRYQGQPESSPSTADAWFEIEGVLYP